MEFKNDKKTIKAWAMFDWANSAYNLVITSTVFPAYYIAVTQGRGDKVEFFGRHFVNTALSNYALATGYLIMVIVLPILSSIADYRGNKMVFMKFFTYMGAIACIGLFSFGKDSALEIPIICFTLAAMGYVGGILFNNSYLPDIATVEEQDRVSAKGYAYGYFGSVLLQIACFVIILEPQWFGITDAYLPSQISFVMVGLWWIGFAQIPFSKLPKASPNNKKLNRKVINSGFQELQKVWHHLKGMKTLKRYLFAFFFYSIGVQTIMLVAAGFGEKVLHLGTQKLITTVLIIQIVAIFGAYLMSYLARKIGNIVVLSIVIVIWIGVCISAYFVSTELQFYVLAAIVGMVMGGVQSLSRSTYSKYLPEDTPDTASFFSFYDVTEKIAIVIGLFSFGYIEEFSGSMRNSAVSMTTFFLIGLLILLSILRMKTPVSNKGVE